MPDDHQRLEEIRPTTGLFHSVYTSWIVLFLGLVLTAAAWYATDQSIRAKVQRQFDNRTSEISSAISARMNGYEQVLQGVAGLFHASENVTRKKFHSYVSSLNIDKNWPGIQGIGFSIPVTVGDKAKHIRDIRNEGFPEYTIKPEADREEYSAIIYLEPFDWRNKRAFGYDMWSNDMRREAMARARDTGKASTSGIITLVQETDIDVQKGFLTYLPLYQDGVSLETIEQRRRAFIGWVYSPFRMGDLMAGILGSDQTEIEYEIYDGDSVSKETMLFDSNKSIHDEDHLRTGPLTKNDTLEFGGRKWSLHFFTNGMNAQGVSESRQPMIVAIAGLVVSFLLFFIVSSLVIRQKYAQKIAQNMATELRIATELASANEEKAERAAELEISNTELVIARDEANMASKAKTEFLAAMSHELRTPLNAILGFAQMMQINPNGCLSPTQNEWVEHILEGGNHLLQLVNQILDLASIEANQINLSLSDIEANETVSNCVDLVAPIGEARSIKVIDNFSHGPSVLLYTDRMRLKQVLINILGNAMKFNNDGGTVTIEGKETDYGYLRISVTDTGIGIAKKDQASLFNIFHRVDADPMIAREGTGIGLTVTKMLMERMAGRLGVESEVGIGSTFWIDIPLASNDDVLIWTDAIETGVDAIDRDHQALVSMFNRLSRRSGDEADVDDTIDDLIEYTQYHFSREEAVMNVCGYPAFESHREHHRRLIDDLNEHSEAWCNDRTQESLTLFRKFLKDWLFNHILKEDTKIANSARGRDRDIRQKLEALGLIIQPAKNRKGN